jgi:hypothetical protein
MIQERRTTDGVAIVTTRAEYIKPRFLAAGIPARVLPVQDGPAWPAHRPPLVLDTIGLPVEVLVALLADPPNVSGLPAHAWAPNTASTGVLVALADAGDWRALRLLALCLAVSLIAPDDPATLRPWIRQLATVQMPRRSQPMPVWLIPPPPPLRLAPLLLRALAALQTSPSIRLAAERCGVSESTMARLLRTTRGVLGMPPGTVSRFYPAEQAALILRRLGTDAPLARQAR